MQYRLPELGDAQAISDCIRSASELSQMTDGSAAGLEDWNDLSGPAEIATRIASGECSLLCCEQDAVIGYIAYKRRNHLSLLFVRKAYQGHGIGRYLIEQTRPQFAVVTLNSTDIAVPFYQKMGFVINGERFLKRGAWSTPMIWHQDVQP